MKCPKCDSEIASNNIELAKDMATCGNCSLIFPVSEYLVEDWEDYFDITNAPEGTYVKDENNKITIETTIRSINIYSLAVFMLIFTIAIIFFFLTAFSSPANGGIVPVIFALLFTGFIIYGWWYVIIRLFGKLVLVLDNQGGKVYSRLINLKLKNQFLWDDVSDVQENLDYRSKGIYGSIKLLGRKTIEFGEGLPQKRRYHLKKLLKILLRKFKQDN